MPRFAYFGTPYVARDTLAHLLAHGYRPTVVITSPDAPRGRGMVMTPSETRVLADAEGIPVLVPGTIDAATIEAIRAYECDYAIVVAYGTILPEALIESFPQGVLNIHYSLLPKYRGASPVEAALLHGDAETGVSIQRMVYALDAGDILAMEREAIAPEDTTRTLRPRLIALGSRLLTDTLPPYLAGAITPVPQDDAQATRCGKIKKSDGELTLSGDARENWNRYRAYAESPGTYCFMEKDGTRMRVKIKDAAFVSGVFLPTIVVPEGKPPKPYERLLESGWRPR